MLSCTKAASSRPHGRRRLSKVLLKKPRWSRCGRRREAQHPGNRRAPAAPSTPGLWQAIPDQCGTMPKWFSVRCVARRCATPSSTSECPRPARTTSCPPAGSRRDVLPLARADLSGMSAGAARPSTSRRRTSSATTPTSRPTATRGCGTPLTTSAAAEQRLGLGPGLVRGGGGQQRRLPAAARRAARGIRCLGIEPAANIAEVAVAKGIPTEVEFLGRADRRRTSAGRTVRADLVAANNVFAHVPDIVDFSRGLRALVADDGYVTIEIPHLLRLIEGREYDTIYHEHFSYLSLLTTQRVLAVAGLTRGGRRGAAVPRRVPAHLVDADRVRRSRRPPRSRPRACPRGATPASHRLAGPRRLRRSRRRGAQRPAGVPHRLLARRVARGGLRGARQGQHVAQPLRHPRRPGGVRGRPQPLQARAVPARDAHPDPSGRGLGRGATRRTS